MKNKKPAPRYDFDFQILDKLSQRSFNYVDLLNSFPIAAEYPRMVTYLQRCGYIEGEEKAYGRIRITPEGQAYLLQLKQSAEEKAEQQTQQRFQNKVSVASVAIPTITFFIGLFVEHYAGILHFLGL